MLCAIWYHLYNLKNVKNTHGGPLLLVKLQPATLLNVTLLHGWFSRFLNCKNGTKSRNRSQLYPEIHKVLPLILTKFQVFETSKSHLQNIHIQPVHFQANIHLLKVNNRNFRKRCEICSKLTIKTPERRQ